MCEDFCKYHLYPCRCCLLNYLPMKTQFIKHVLNKKTTVTWAPPWSKRHQTQRQINWWILDLKTMMVNQIKISGSTLTELNCWCDYICSIRLFLLSLPERGAEHSVGCLYLLALRCHSTEVTLVQRGVEASLQRSVDVGQSHQVLRFL